MVKNDSETREQATLRLARDPNSWQRWPRLPLIRHLPGPETEYGFLVDGSGFTVFEGLIYLPITKDARTWVYETPEALLADGWKVD